MPIEKREVYKGQRTKEKRELFKRFKHPAIEDLFKNRFFLLFNNKCYKCGAEGKLDIDHHIPLILGGHFVPGNLVPLCKRCNRLKSDLPPEGFYTQNELEKLRSILEKEESVFAFRFDYDAWRNDRKGYLIQVGVEPALVDDMINNPEHPYYIEPPMEPFVISINLAELLGNQENDIR